MSHLGATLRLDVKVQLRSKLYHVGLAMAVITGFVIRMFFSAEQAGIVIPAFFLVAIGGTTFGFAGGMVLLEKSQGTLDALRTSPVTTRDYLLSKALTLTIFAGVESLVVLVIAHGGRPPAPLILVAGLLGLGLAYTLLGLGLVASHESVTTFVFPDALVLVGVLQGVFFGIFDVGPQIIYYFIPAQGPFLLMLGAFAPLETWQWTYAVIMTMALVVGSYFFARARFRTHIRLQPSSA
jgi:ABC-type Na+ efflux pump permease subunit